MSTDICEAVFFFDGLCEPVNPGGVACYGWVGYWRGKLARQGFGVVGEGPTMTNNLAEYNGLLAAMRFLLRNNYHGMVEFRGDSKLVINQMAGAWQAHNPRLRRLREAALGMANGFQEVYYKWIPREQNTEADALSRTAYFQFIKRGEKNG